ncbi:MAG: transcription termination factor NusA, partial [Alphaproteobacteria bacterium]|nr:transcription termination factor NusA [Alphaproteobacteria bacterium]
MNTALHRRELLEVAESVAREKGILLEEVVQAMILAFQKAAEAKYGREHDIRTEIDPVSGEVRFFRCHTVVEEIEQAATEITVEQARKIAPEKSELHEVGAVHRELLPPIDMGRVAARTIKDTIVKHVREAERARQYEEYKDRVGQIVNGLVKRVEYGDVYIELAHAEALMRKSEAIPRETHHPGDRIRCYIQEVRSDQRGPQILLSRCHPQFMAELFSQEVPEVYDGVIEIKSVARDPGSRAKIAVISHDSAIDPVGACVGMRGSRVQAVVGELQGEKIDIVPWSSDPATFVVNALAPAEVAKVILDEDSDRMEVIVPEDQLSLAIGRKGQSVNLATDLTGWQIELLTEAHESARRQEEMMRRTKFFAETLDVDDMIAHLLSAEGFATLEQIAQCETGELSQVEGFDESLAGELGARARAWLAERDREYEERRRAAGVTDALAEMEGLTPAMVAKLGDAEVRTIEDLADLSRDEMFDILGEHLPTVEEIDRLIMTARAPWYADDPDFVVPGDETAETADEPGETATATTAASATAPEFSDAPVTPREIFPDFPRASAPVTAREIFP